ncbi:hypothetical protein SMICM17S_12171 [Streptomyces microflavus]
MPIRSQITSSGSREAADGMKSPGRSEISSSTRRPASRPMFSSVAASSRGVKRREIIRRSAACSGPSMLTIEFPNSAFAQPAGSGVVTPGALAKTFGVRLAVSMSAWRTRA